MMQALWEGVEEIGDFEKNVGTLANTYISYMNEMGGIRDLLVLANSSILPSRHILLLRKILGRLATICWEMHDND